MGSVGESTLQPRVSNGYLTRKVQDLMSLARRVVVITGGARGIGLALAFAVAEVGASVAVIDAAAEPDKDFNVLQAMGAKARYYK
jgi:sorbose reductase